MALAPTPENFRAEMARHRLKRDDLAEAAGMHPNQWSQFSTGTRPLQGWAAHNMGYAINHLTGLRLIDVDMELGLKCAPRPGKAIGWKQPGSLKPLRAERQQHVSGAAG